MSTYDHPNKPGWQMIKISHGRKGKPEYIPYKGTRDEALMFERELRGVADRSDPGFLDFIPDFKVSYKNRTSTRGFEVCENSLKHLEEYFGGMKMRHLTGTPIEQYKHQRLTTGGRDGKGVTRRTVNIELSILSAYITWMNETHKTEFPRPKRFGKRETKAALPQVLTIEEFTALTGKLSGDIKTIVMLMSLCGMRRNEVLHLTAFNVDIPGELIRVEGKGGKWRMVPISSKPILTELKKLCKKRPEGPLFASPKDPSKPRVDIRKPIRAAAKAAGITKHVNPHLFRHSFGAALVNTGTDIRIIQELLGHSELATTQIYTQIATESKRTATAHLAAMVANTKKLIK